MQRRILVPLPLAAALCSTPALADHPIAGGGVSHGGPIVTLSAETLDAGTLAGGVKVQVSRPDAYSDAELVALAGRHVHAHTTDHNLSVAASLAYGVTGHLTVSLNLPFLLRDDLRAGEHSHAGGAVSNRVERLGSVSGVGDLSLMGQYVLAHDHAQGWFVSVLGGLKLPTGSTGERDRAGNRLETEHQPGTGSWDPLLGFAASKRWGRWSLHGSGLYQVSTAGAQDTRLGDRLNLGAALVYELSASAPHRHGEEHAHSVRPKWAAMLEASHEREGRQTVAGAVEPDSGSEVLWLSPGLRVSAPAGWSVALSAGVPLWQDVGLSHPANRFRAVAQVGVGF